MSIFFRGVAAVAGLAAAALAAGWLVVKSVDSRGAITSGERCRAMGEAASRDAACRALWQAGRDRFLGKAP